MNKSISAQSASMFRSPLKNSNHAFIPKTLGATDRPNLEKVAFILLDHFSMSAFSVALDSFVTTNLVHPTPIYQTNTYGLDTTEVLSDLGIGLPTDGTLRDVDLDDIFALVICGGYRNRLTSLPKLNAMLVAAHQRGVVLCGLWNGAFYLADAGIVAKESISIHQDNRALMQERFPSVDLSSAPYTAAGDLMTCSGPNSVLDMMLAFIATRHGDNCARAVEEVIGLDRTASKENASPPASLLNRPQLPRELKEAIMLMESNVEEPLCIGELADLVGISRRQIERLFHRHLGVAPARYYMEHRLTQARRLLQQSAMSITDISVACGFVSTTHFSRNYRHFFGQPPTDARR